MLQHLKDVALTVPEDSNVKLSATAPDHYIRLTRILCENFTEQ